MGRSSLAGFSCFVVVAALALDMACGTAPVVRPGNDARFARRIDGLAGLENVAEVASGIYRGSQPEGPEGWASLRKLGVKTVVSLRTLHGEKKDVIAAGLEPVEVPLVADLRGSRPPSREDVQKFLDTLRDPAKRPVYFHCAFGKDRTGTMCAIYRMEVDGWTPDEAYAEMEHFGFRDLWVSLREFVRDYKPEGRWRNSR